MFASFHWNCAFHKRLQVMFTMVQNVRKIQIANQMSIFGRYLLKSEGVVYIHTYTEMKEHPYFLNTLKIKKFRFKRFTYLIV